MTIGKLIEFINEDETSGVSLKGGTIVHVGNDYIGCFVDGNILFVDNCISKTRNNASEDILCLLFSKDGKYQSKLELLEYLKECLNDEKAGLTLNTVIELSEIQNKNL